MRCRECDKYECGDDDCDYCEPIIVIGLCNSCNKTAKCEGCNKQINLKEDHDHVRNALYEYWCNKKCHETQKARRKNDRIS